MFKNLKLSKILDPCSTFIIVFEKKWKLYIFSKSHNLNLTFLLFFSSPVTKNTETKNNQIFDKSEKYLTNAQNLNWKLRDEAEQILFLTEPI